MTAKDFTKEIISNSFFNEKQLAILLKVDQSLISHWKDGTRTIGSNHFFELLDILGYSKLDFVNGHTEPKVRLGFKAKSISNEQDLYLISKINKLAANVSLMEMLTDNDRK